MTREWREDTPRLEYFDCCLSPLTLNDLTGEVIIRKDDRIRKGRGMSTGALSFNNEFERLAFERLDSTERRRKVNEYLIGLEEVSKEFANLLMRKGLFKPSEGTKELIKKFPYAMESLMHLLDFDLDTFGHTLRMSNLSTEVLDFCNLKDENLIQGFTYEQLLTAAIHFHDMGKIYRGDFKYKIKGNDMEDLYIKYGRYTHAIKANPDLRYVRLFKGPDEEKGDYSITVLTSIPELIKARRGLTKEERGMIRKHPTHSGKWLNARKNTSNKNVIDFLRRVIVRHHEFEYHGLERNIKNYPRKKAKSPYSIETQMSFLLALIDKFEVLSAYRLYRKKQFNKNEIKKMLYDHFLREDFYIFFEKETLVCIIDALCDGYDDLKHEEFLLRQLFSSSGILKKLRKIDTIGVMPSLRKRV